METLTAKQFKERYGAVAESQFQQQEKEKNVFSEIQDTFSQGVSKVGQGIEEAKPIGGQGVGGLVTGVGKIIGGATEAITSPLSPIFKPISNAINAIGEKIGEIPAVQKFAISPAGEATSKIAETVGNYAEGAGLVAGGATGAKAIKAVPAVAKTAVEAIPKPNITGTVGNAAGAIRDVIPTKQGTINTQVAKALELTPADLSIFEAKSGTGVGEFLAENNLIRENKAATQQAIDTFFEQNYKDVRTAIAAVKDEYKLGQVPGYYDALKQIQKTIQQIPGLEETAVKVENLMNKPTVQLIDIQATKELVDDFFNLYDRSGDVLQNASKEGMANIRAKLQTFIEDQVAEKTGQDIRGMNRNVAASKELSKSITKRSTRGLTRMHFTWRDAAMGLGLTYFGSPLLGVAAVFIMKMLNSPTVRLRFARYVDGLNDAQKARLSQQIAEGKVPSEMLKAVNVPESDLIQGPQTGQPEGLNQ